ncbi:prepilin-type N-terminal cleavage/methylation domain-containing protein [Haloimpatiens sp. FM7315]|uniref:prepilin-type N-terminal cleavage/methylation domain-containing protein n=1 Tax=Haloimpatiens sp. FM7315 TaxID=3298609 RepID=UPI00370AD39E
MVKKKGFTLIELTVVISIIAIISLISVPNYIKHINYARREEAINLGRQINLEVIDFEYNENEQNNNYRKIENYIKENLGIEVICKYAKDEEGEGLISVLYKSNDSDFECVMNVKKNNYEIFNGNKVLLYKSFK